MSFKKAHKSLQRTHKERSQPKNRQHLGILEKHKDYKERADDYKKKQRHIQALREKAAFRNPDEFYFAMNSSKTEGGVHKREHDNKTYTKREMIDMTSQDVSYLLSKRQAEKSKIEQLQSALHCLPEKPQNKHTVFVDSKKEAEEFTPEEYFDTVPELVDRAFNRLTKEQLQKEDVVVGRMAGVSKLRKRQYSELHQRLNREEQLGKMISKLETKKKLMSDKSKRRKIKKGKDGKPPVWKWAKERKK